MTLASTGRRLGFAPALALFLLPIGLAGAEEPFQEVVFRAGQDGYHTYRIPSILVTPKGDLLAFCEGRKRNRSDTGDIDLVMKRSRDQGRTWSSLSLVAEDGPNTFGNPCPVVDRTTGTIWLALTHNRGEDKQDAILAGTGQGTRTAWICHSEDDGRTWSKPVEITRTVKRNDWTWIATGPGVGIQLASGRLVIPCDHYLAGSQEARAHVMYSDDQGASWKLGGTVVGDVNECQAAEIEPNVVMLNLRNTPFRKQAGRAVALSRDGGLSFEAPVRDPALPEPGCQASLVRLPGEDHQVHLAFSNPASLRRERLTVRLSRDGGRSWPHARLLHAGPAAYSCLTVLPDGTIGCLYERGEQHAYETITFARFRVEWLSQVDN